MSEKMVKISDKHYPDKRTVTMSRYEELQEKYDYDRWEIIRDATEGEVNQRTSFGPNVQSEEDNQNEEEFMKNTNEEGEVVVELSKNKEGSKTNVQDTMEVDPYSEKAEKFFEEEELSAMREAHEEENPRSVGDKSSQEVISEIEEEMKELQEQQRKEKRREKVRDQVETWDPRFGTKVEEMSAENFSELMANAQDGKTLEQELEEQVDSILEEEETESEEELSSNPDPETAKEAVSVWGSERYSNTVFEEFASSIEEDSDIQGEVEELEEENDRESTPVETSVKKDGKGNARVSSNDPQIKSELRSAEKEGFATILEEGETMKAKVENWEDM